MIGSHLEILKRESFTFILSSHFGRLFRKNAEFREALFSTAGALVVVTV